MYDLAALRQAVDEILEAIDDDPRGVIGEPINWADLHCLEVAGVLTADGQTYHRVLIEEAAPECSKFCEYIAERLAERGFEGVEVVTEW